MEVPIYLEEALDILQGIWSVFRADDNPFDNSGASYTGKVLEVHAYDWGIDDEDGLGPNFIWRDLNVYWYKYHGRGMSCSREISRKEVCEMLTECIAELIGG